MHHQQEPPGVYLPAHQQCLQPALQVTALQTGFAEAAALPASNAVARLRFNSVKIRVKAIIFLHRISKK